MLIFLGFLDESSLLLSSNNKSMNNKYNEARRKHFKEKDIEELLKMPRKKNVEMANSI
jgi:hypothetical protein